MRAGGRALIVLASTGKRPENDSCAHAVVEQLPHAPPLSTELDGLEMTVDAAVLDAVRARSRSPIPTAAANQAPR